MKPPDTELLKKLDYRHPATWIATWFGFGFARPAPGTWGTLGAIPFGLILLAIGKPALLVGIVVVFALGLWASEKFEAMTGTHDNSMIVIDEVAGFWIALLAASGSFWSIAIAFALFRFFDILKPWPVSWLDQNLPGARGVMADDVMAGAYAAMCLWGIERYAFAG